MNYVLRHAPGDGIDNDLVSVAMTVRHSRDLNAPQFDALARQVTNRPWELVISIEDFASVGAVHRETLSAAAPAARLVPSLRSGIAAGRNAAHRATRGSAILTCDSDDVVSDGWIDEMCVALSGADVVAGTITIGSTGTAIDSSEGVHRRSAYPYYYLPVGLTANLGYKRFVFDELQGFDESLRTGEDVDFSWRAQEAGFAFRHCAALVRKSARQTPRQRFHQHRQFGRDDVLLYRKHRDFGLSPRGFDALRAWAWLVLNMPRLRSASTRHTYAGVLGHRIGRLEGSMRMRAVFP